MKSIQKTFEELGNKNFYFINDNGLTLFVQYDTERPSGSFLFYLHNMSSDEPLAMFVDGNFVMVHDESSVTFTNPKKSH